MAAITTTKVCPKCGGSCMVPLYSTSEKICNDCKHVIKWPLDNGQKPALTGDV